MSTHLQIPCPQCQNSLRVRREYLGRRVQCKRCEYVFEAADPEAPERAAVEESFEESLIRELDRVPEPAQVEVGQGVRQSQGDQDSPLDGYGETLTPESSQGRNGLSVSEEHDDDAEQQERQRSEELQQELVAAQDELRGLRSQLDRLNERNAWADRLEGELKDAKAEIETLRAELQEASTNILPTNLPALETAAQELAGTLAERDRLSAEADVLRAELQAVQTQGRNHAQALASLQTERDDLNRQLQDARQALETELATRQAQWDDERQSLINDARANLDQQQARADAETLRRQDQHDRDTAELNTRIEALTKQADRHAAHARDLEAACLQNEERHQAALKTERNTAAQLQTALDQSRQNADAASKRADGFSLQVQHLNDQMETLRLEHQTEAQSLQGRLDTLSQDLETARSDALARRNDDAQTIADRDQRISELQTQLQDHRANLESTRAEAETQREQAVDRIKGLERMVQERQDQLADRDRQLAEGRAALESAQAEARKEHDFAVETERRQTSEIDQLRARQAELEQEIESIRATAAQDRQRADEAAEAAQRELANAQTKIDELTADLNAAREAKNQIRGLLARIGIQLPNS